MSLWFGIVALVIFFVTKKNLALSASMMFFVTWMIPSDPDAMSVEVATLSVMAINFVLFMVALAEYTINRTPLGRVLMWLYLSSLAVTASYTIQVTVAQGHVLIAMAVVELIALLTLDGCRSFYGDIRLTIDSIRRGLSSALHRNDGEG